MRARLIPIAELETRDVDAWRELAATAVGPNPFFEPELVLPATRELGVAAGLLVCEDEAGWAACLPVHKPRRWRLPIPMLAGWRHLYSYLGTPLVRRDGLEDALAALIGRGTDEPGTAALARTRTSSGSRPRAGRAAHAQRLRLA